MFAHWTARTDENKEKPHSGQPVSQQRFEQITTRMQHYSIAAIPTCSVVSCEVGTELLFNLLGELQESKRKIMMKNAPRLRFTPSLYYRRQFRLLNTFSSTPAIIMCRLVLKISHNEH
jgi:hypothetical protein